MWDSFDSSSSSSGSCNISGSCHVVVVVAIVTILLVLKEKNYLNKAKLEADTSQLFFSFSFPNEELHTRTVL